MPASSVSSVRKIWRLAKEVSTYYTANCFITNYDRTFRPIFLALPPDAPPPWYPNVNPHCKAVKISEARRTRKQNADKLLALVLNAGYDDN
jgi:hypothetical protein